ncbi:hypothetical protein ACFWZU_10315 [Frateuria sp. GZRR33]|uniref:hypothetical protein n=1 Tax=Frateuria sp. GZRR33 TaxID=3351535 RepID=UPI003EDC3FD2
MAVLRIGGLGEDTRCSVRRPARKADACCISTLSLREKLSAGRSVCALRVWVKDSTSIADNGAFGASPVFSV